MVAITKQRHEEVLMIGQKQHHHGRKRRRRKKHDNDGGSVERYCCGCPNNRRILRLIFIPWAVLGLGPLIWTLGSEQSILRRLGLRRRQQQQKSDNGQQSHHDDGQPQRRTAATNGNNSGGPLRNNITAIIMNYDRPLVLQRSSLLPTLLRHEFVTEILLLHANPATFFVYDHPKVQNIDASHMNDEIGLAVRFHYCRTSAINDFVLHVDDDMEILVDDEEQTDHDNDHHHPITILQRHLQDDPDRVVGRYARSYNYWRAPHRHGYANDKDVYGDAPVILTKLLMLHRKTCDAFFRYAPLMDDLALSSTPRWNGEDIFVNLVATHVHPLRRPNLAVNIAVREAAIVGESHPGVSGTSLWATNAHAYYRGRFWATAAQRLKDAGIL
jgi:hypothetical protein